MNPARSLEDFVESLSRDACSTVLAELQAHKQSTVYHVFCADLRHAVEQKRKETMAQPRDLVEVLNRENNLGQQSVLEKHIWTLDVLEELLTNKINHIPLDNE